MITILEIADDDVWRIVNELRAQWLEDDPDEPFFWLLTDCSEEGWRVDIVWPHHDGDIPCFTATAPDLLGAIKQAIVAYRNVHDQRA